MTDNPLAAVLREHKPGDASYFGRPVCSCRWEDPAVGYDSDAGHAAWVQHVAPLLAAAQRPQVMNLSGMYERTR